MSSAYLSLAVLLFLLSPCLPLSPPDLLLYDGVSLYSRGDWLGARARMQETLHSLGQLRNIRLQCAALCGLGNSRAEELAWKTGPDSDAESGKEQKAQAGDSRLEETVLGRAHCLSRCEHLKLGDPSLYRLTRDTEQLLHRGAPYNYLQLVHYKLEELDEAAAAAFTFYTRNPKHEQIQTDVKRYRHMRGVREKSFRDLEEPRHRTLYSQAVTLLSEGRAGPAVSRLEESLVLSLSALEECRTLCEGTRENENETHRDLPEVIAEYYVQVLQCKQHCVLDDSVRLGPEHPAQDVILSQLSLLEEAYTKLGDLESAALAAHLLQLFHQWSKSEEPQGNTEEPQGNTEEPQGNTEEPQKFVGKLQKNITSYIRRALAEKKLLYYSMENLGISFHDPDSWTPDEIIPESIKERVRMEREARAQSRGDLPYDGVSVTMTPAQMNGTRRVALDGVISEEDCQGLLIMAQMAEGSGFKARRSPHTPHERMQSLSVLQSLKLAALGAVDPSHAQLYYHASERSRVLAQSYFGTPRLHFSYAQLVCRSAIEGEQEGRADLSHPVHADNCLLDPEEKKCWREPPAYVHRDYSGILYLNEDFQGGDLFFTELDGSTVTAELRPRCGRLLLFSSGEENPHGVRAVTNGRRCAIALWFTESSDHAEQERLQARIIMGDVDSSRQTLEEETLQANQETRITGRETARTGRETARSSRGTARISDHSESDRPSGRSQRVSQKFEDEL